jgi:hypothetical protein
MSVRLLTVFSVVAALLPCASLAQDRTSKEQPRPGNATAPRPADPAVPIRASSNIRVEITITDAIGSTPQKKTVSMTIADRRMGRIRSTNRGASAILNVDATPSIVTEGNRVHLQLVLEYLPELTGESAPRVAPINEMITVVLETGKPMAVSQAADPASDRRVSVEVTATILK